MLKHIGLSEFSSRAGDDTHFTSNWGGWTALNRDPQQDYGNVRNAFSDKTVHEDDFLLFHAFDGEPGLFVDVGANMGFSATSLRNVNKTFAVLPFEVVPFLVTGYAGDALSIPGLAERMTILRKPFELEALVEMVLEMTR